MGSRWHLAAGEHLPKREQPETDRKKAWPPAVNPNTQSGKNAGTGATGGFEAGKRVKAGKRRVLTDALGNVLASHVLPADAVDGVAAIACWDEVAALRELLGQGHVIFVNSSFNGVFRAHMAQRNGIRVEKPSPVLVEKNELLHPCLALDCRAHLCQAQGEPSIVKAIRAKLDPRQRLDYLGKHQTSSQMLLTQTISKP